MTAAGAIWVPVDTPGGPSQSSEVRAQAGEESQHVAMPGGQPRQLQPHLTGWRWIPSGDHEDRFIALLHGPGETEEDGIHPATRSEHPRHQEYVAIPRETGTAALSR